MPCPVYICHSCGNDFSSGQSLQYHVDKQVCLKNIKKCDLCLKTFRSKSALKYHQDKKVCAKRIDHLANQI